MEHSGRFIVGGGATKTLGQGKGSIRQEIKVRVENGQR